MMRMPGRKESGVIFTTVTELPPNERLERSERERPSGSGLERSREETAGSESEREEPNEGGEERRGQKRRGWRGRTKKKRETRVEGVGGGWRYRRTLNNSERN